MKERIESFSGSALCPFCGGVLVRGELKSEKDVRLLFKPSDLLKKKIILKSEGWLSPVSRRAWRCPECKMIIVKE